MSSEAKTVKRKRGIKASRQKLEKALTDSGFNTQAALAEHIADIENLEAAPKDLVNRVFREKSVSHGSIQRIARALNVEAYTLYKSNNDTKVTPSTDNDIEPTSNTAEPLLKHQKKSILLVALFFLIIASLLYLLLHSETTKESPSPNLNDLSFAVIDSPNPSIAPFTEELRAYLSKRFKMATAASSALVSNDPTWQQVDKLGVDFTLVGEVIEKERHKGLLVYLASSSSRELVASFVGLDLVPTAQNISKFSLLVELGIEARLQHKALPLETMLTKEALPFYLDTLAHLDGSNITHTIQLANDSLHRVLRISPQSAKAKALECDLLVRQSIVNQNKEILEDAMNECDRANILDPSLPELKFAYGQVYRKLGQTDEAIKRYLEAIAEYPNYIDARLGLAESYLNKFQQTKDHSYFELALSQISEAEKHQPNFWKVYLVKSRIQYYKGEPDKAIASLNLSLEIKETYASLANLGTLYFCKGDLKNAESSYKRLEIISDPSAYTDHLLGVISYSLRNYDDAAKYQQASLNRIMMDGSSGLYMEWINLGDSLYAQGKIAEAKGAFQKAILAAENYRLHGENDNNIQVHIFYSNLRLHQVTGKPLDESSKRKFIKDFTPIAEHATDPEAKLRELLTWTELGNVEQANEIFDSFYDSCKGYVTYPQLAKFYKLRNGSRL
ncbi:tetratricopeptide repeat protein [Paraglaciecola sp. 2405UD69-4]|uniref:tetratricopeptide repeat protein n=1 Tax=Paraglaciecola sp. 2405UD69-4 TaxID=3391836 RepID=UPI0039C9884A